MRTLSLLAVLACVTEAPRDPVEVEPVPSGEGSGGGACTVSDVVVSDGVDLGSVLGSTFLAATPDGFVVTRMTGSLDVLATVLTPEGEVVRTVDVTDDVPLPPHEARLVTRPSDFLVVWATEFELGWRTLGADGTLGEPVSVSVRAFTTPVSAVWYAGALEVVVTKPGEPDRLTRYALDGAVLAGPVDVPLSNRIGGVIDHDPARGELLHLHTIQAGEREELWRVPLDLGGGPGDRVVLYEAATLHAGSVLRRPQGTLVALDDDARGAVLVSADDGELRASIDSPTRAHPALAEGEGCVALAVQPDEGGIALRLFDGALAPVGEWTLIEATPVRGPHQLTHGHGQLALTWTEPRDDGTVLWFHTAGR